MPTAKDIFADVQAQLLGCQRATDSHLIAVAEDTLMSGFCCKAVMATCKALSRSHSAVCSPTTSTFGQVCSRP